MYSKRFENSIQFNKNIENHDIIKYSCNCGKAYHVTELYYCNGCLKTNCKFCISEDIDCFYCPTCLEHVSSAEASINGNRCKKCFDCPICFNILTYSASTNASNGNETFFLNCGFCKWNSINSCEKEFRFDSHSIKVGKESTELYQQFVKVLEIVGKECMELTSLKDKKTLTRIKLAQAMKQFLGQQSKHQKYNQRKNFLKSDEQRWIQSSSPNPLPDNSLIPNPTIGNTSSSTTGNQLLLTNQMIKKSIQTTPITTVDTDEMQKNRIESRMFHQVNGTEEVEYDDDIDLSEINKAINQEDSGVSGLNQRYHQVSNQSRDIRQLLPQHRQLLSRRSKRCKRCDRLLVKPDINPGKTEFKRQHFAYSYIPRIQIIRIDWIDTDLFQIDLLFTNPLHSQLFLSFPMEIKGSMISLDDNSQLVDLYTHETFINGLLDETDDLEKETLNQQLQSLEESRYFINRKDNKLTLRFIGKVGVEETLFTNVNQDETTHLIIHLPNQSQLNSSTGIDNNQKFISKFQNIKFTVVFEFSSKSKSTLPTTTTTTTTAEPSLSSSGTAITNDSSNPLQKTLLKVLFDIPCNKFTNTEL